MRQSKMKKEEIDKLEFITSIISALLLYILAYIQYTKEKPFFWIILIVAIMLSVSAYLKYKQYKNNHK